LGAVFSVVVVVVGICVKVEERERVVVVVAFAVVQCVIEKDRIEIGLAQRDINAWQEAAIVVDHLLGIR